jgi:predicted GTPase
MKKGAPKAVVRLKTKQEVTFNYPYDVEEIKRFCKDGDFVHSIEIFYESDQSGTNLAFYDTPGIDSTDPAHREATENVIHLADLIFYVMDYNHILSETNVEFIKELINKGKEVRLIINQIDKHRDEELTFKDFKEKVFNSFNSYGIEKENIFFTSVKNKTFPQNDLSALTAYLKKIEMNKDRLLVEGTGRQINDLVTQYIETEEENRVSLEIILQKLETLQAEKDKLLSNRIKQKEIIKEKEESIRNQFMKIVDSAQLMPYETREKAGLFIDSVKNDFKVGLFFSKQKTNQERDARKKAFQEKLKESIDAHINWHAQNQINNLQKELKTEIPQWDPIVLNEEILYSFVQSGLSSQGQGLLNYCDNIAGEAKKQARKQIAAIMSIVMQEIHKEYNEASLNSNRAEEELSKGIESLTIEKENAMKWEDNKNELNHILSVKTKDLYDADEFESYYLSQFKQISAEQFKEEYFGQNDEKELEVEKESVNVTSQDNQTSGSLEKETEKLIKTASLLKPITQLEHLSQELDDLAKRLGNRYFTMVLFGAFSAGKSSFANALLGENILPSSPNPTTAAINEVRKPEKGYAHGTVKIEMKSEIEVRDEINNILKFDSDHLPSIMNQLNLESLEQEQGKHLKHLQAFKEGYQWAENALNKTITTDLSEVSKYAAVESNACFVKKITIYYSCPITEKGIVLVDTPGANSIHSRHTEVAFEYMKHADIIIYLTYFNHAFSYTDREFLIQLGRIKDTFSSDKMFFAINASDLAETKEDELAVVDHVKNNLQTFGIRHPRLFPVSSKNERMGAQGLDPGFSDFRNSLNNYLENDLERAMVLSAENSQNHVKKVIRNMIAETNLRIEKEDEYILAVQQREDELLKLCEDQIVISTKRLHQEMKELLFYVKQRALIRYHDFYKETIHPAAVKSAKPDLVQSLQELYEKVAHDLQQEYRASSLRLDKWIQLRLDEKEKIILNDANDKQVSLQHSPEDKENYLTPPVPAALANIAAEGNNEWLSYFKNTKQFFEKGGSSELRNELVKTVEQEITIWIETVEDVLKEHYKTVAQNAAEHTKAHYIQQINNYFTELKKPGDLGKRIEVLESSLKQIENL